MQTQRLGGPYPFAVFATDIIERLDQAAALHKKSLELIGRPVPQTHEDTYLSTLEFAKATVVRARNEMLEEVGEE